MRLMLLLALTTFTDARDGTSYPVVEIAGMTWMGRNLEYALTGSHCFGDDATQCAERGRLYTWDQAMRACPAGWHLTTEAEWRRLEQHLGMAPGDVQKERGRGEGLGEKLKIGGSSGLEILFAGWRGPDGAYSVGNGNDVAAALWTATEADPEAAWHRDLSSKRTVIWRSKVDKPYSLSVRCARDE